MKKSWRIEQIVSSLCILALGGAAGCYERVVRAEGLGAQGIAVQKPYRSETALDRAVFPEPKKSDSGYYSAPNSSSVPTPTAPR